MADCYEPVRCVFGWGRGGRGGLGTDCQIKLIFYALLKYITFSSRLCLSDLLIYIWLMQVYFGEKRHFVVVTVQQCSVKKIIGWVSCGNYNNAWISKKYRYKAFRKKKEHLLGNSALGRNNNFLKPKKKCCCKKQ